MNLCKLTRNLFMLTLNIMLKINLVFQVAHYYYSKEEGVHSLKHIILITIYWNLHKKIHLASHLGGAMSLMPPPHNILRLLCAFFILGAIYLMRWLFFFAIYFYENHMTSSFLISGGYFSYELKCLESKILTASIAMPMLVSKL